MSSPTYSGPSSPTCIFSLPLEILEQIIISCAFSGSPESIASFSQTCRTHYELIYASTDSHLWREFFLATFDDPRKNLKVLGRPIVPDTADDVAFDWKTEYRRRIRAGKMVEAMKVDSQTLASDLNALSSTATSALLQLPVNSSSANVAWCAQLFANGFPSALLRRLTLNDSQGSVPVSEQIIMRLDWERSAAGREFYRLFFLSGFRGGPADLEDSDNEDEDEDGRYNLRSSSSRKKKEPKVKLRALARTVARHRVYNLPYLSAERCWGPFLRASSPPLPLDDVEDESIPEDNGITNGKGKERAVDEIMDKKKIKKVKKHDNEDPDALQAAQVNITFLRAILNNFDTFFDSQDPEPVDDDEEEDGDYTPPDDDHHHHYQFEFEEQTGEENEDDAISETNESYFTDDSEVPQDLFMPASGPLPIYPPDPHLLFPDYAFLSAARLVVAENLRERYKSGSSNDSPMWPWFTTTAAVEATRELLLRMGVLLPPKPGDIKRPIEVENNIESSGGSSDDRGWESLRMGSAPGFWDCRGNREGWTGVVDEAPQVKPEMPTPWWRKDEDLKYLDDVEGWDWAGAEGKWMRAVCWMDYRDLLFHNLQTTYPIAARYHQEIQETCRVFAMTLKVVGYSRVPAPSALPAPSAESSSSSSSNGERNAKDKELTSTSNGHTHYDPLVYALPIIHVVGEFRGSDVDDSVARRSRGTIRMIGDRAIRWNLISSEVSSPDRDEWVMEGIQVGGIGSAMGVVGMWTGASHERGDPIGPSWAWKIE